MILSIVIYLMSLQLSSIRTLNRLNKSLNTIALEYLSVEDSEKKTRNAINNLIESEDFNLILLSHPEFSREGIMDTLSDYSTERIIRVFSEYLGPYQDEILTSFEILIISTIAMFFIFATLLVISLVENYKVEAAKSLKIDADKNLIDYLEKEKDYISLDLHDDIGQKLIAIKQYLSDRDEFSTVNRYISDIIYKIRKLSHSLRSPEFDRHPLKDQVRLLCSDFASLTNIRIEYEHLGLTQLDLPMEISQHTYRIIQELLSNAVKHSEATELKINLVYIHPTLKVTYKDNGIGLNIENNKNLGIKSIRFRLNIINSEYEIIPEDIGFHIHIKIPVEI